VREAKLGDRPGAVVSNPTPSATQNASRTRDLDRALLFCAYGVPVRLVLEGLDVGFLVVDCPPDDRSRGNANGGPHRRPAALRQAIGLF
jgi:hypothetical protein